VTPGAQNPSAGKTIRLKRLISQPHGTSVICALDHGMTSPTFLGPLADIEQRTREAVAGGANVIMMSKGMIRRAASAFGPETSFAMLLTASATGAADAPVVAIAEVEEACRLGADAVVVFVALTGAREPEMIRFVADVGNACDRLGMPFIAEAEFPTTYAAVEELTAEYGVDYLLRNARLCAELGADVVKSNWSGDADSYARVVEAAGVPVVLAGGSRISDKELLHRMEQAMQVGAIGCSVGRNIFMHEQPEAMTRALARVIREKWSAEDALAELEKATGA
jgi:fructose-bisphosphate aldolase / 2-amino-3,7-dideoxy-D-threo-hept-6-ulosonate synthase